MEQRPSAPYPPASEAPELVMTDSELFWQEHWQKFAWGLAVLVALIIAAGVWMFYTAQVRSAAEALYSTAQTPGDWREVIAQYPRSVPAGNARLLLAESLRAAGDLEGSLGELEKFVEEQPEHPMAGAGWLTIGETRQLLGRQEAALQAYRVASSQYKESSAAPLAMIAEARLLNAMNQAGEARAVLESIGTLYPQTPAAMVAAGEMASLSVEK